MKRITAISLCLIFISIKPIFSQLDSVHWLSPLHARDNSQIGKHYIYLSTPEVTPFNVTIKDGSGKTLGVKTISNVMSDTIYIGNGQSPATKMMVPKDSLNTILKNKGYKLIAPKPFYANFRAYTSAQAGSLTSKGRGGAGTVFRYGGFPQLTGGATRSFVASIMAIENNTLVQITDYDTSVVFSGIPTNNSNSLSFNLNAGETYVISGDASISANLNGFMGALVTSSNPITFSNGNWLGQIQSAGGQDIAIDQSVPVEGLGTEYILIEGDGLPGMENGIVVAHYDSTDVFAGGNLVGSINAGEYLLIDNSYYIGTSHKNIYVKTSQPSYMYQALGGSANNTTPGLNFIPPISCLLNYSVGPIPSVEMIGSNTYSGAVVAFTRTGATLSVNGIPQSGAEAIFGLSNWETYKIAGLTGDITITSTMPLGAGIFGKNGVAGFAGYFAGFGKNMLGVNLVDSSCVYTTITEINGLFDSYQWLFDSIPVPGAISNAYTPSIAGNYALETSQGICKDTFPVYVLQEPIVNAMVTDVQCFGNNDGTASLILTGGISPYVVDWGTADTNSLSAGTYSYTVTDNFGCIKEDSVLIEQSDLIEMDSVVKSLLCQGDTNASIYLNISGGINPYSYLWSDSSNLDSLVGLSSGNYQITISDSNNCKDSMNVIIYDPDSFDISITDDTTICYGSAIILNAYGGMSYLWSNGNLASSINAKPLQDTIFYVTGYNDSGCVALDSVNVIVLPPPIAYAGQDSTVIKGESIKLNGSGGIDFLWVPNDYLDCDNCHDPISKPDNDITYVLSVTDTNGCISTDTINITVDFFSNIYMPSAFSPNGDGINDVFYVRGLNISEIQLMIFDRWGNLVFETTDQSIGWNGYYRGTLFVPEVFMYVLTGKDPEGKKINFKGNITLVL